MKHGLLYGAHDVTLDLKHRMLVPAEVRKCINTQTDGEAFFVVTGINRKPWFYLERVYEELAEAETSVMAPGLDRLEKDATWYARSTKIPIDNAGRILIPDKILKKAELGKELTFIGMRDHLQLWNRADWMAYDEELDRKNQEKLQNSAGMKQPPAAS